MTADHEIMTVTATCGHPVTFRINPHKSMKDRIAKHRDRKCGPCRIADHEQDLANGLLAPGVIKKGQEPKHLPKGAHISLLLGDDKVWDGVLMADGISVKAQGTGLMGMASKLAKKWLTERGYKVKK